MCSPLAFTICVPTMKRNVEAYKPPKFAERVSQYAPSHRVNLAMHPTPIQTWDLHSAISGLPEGVEFYIKRDDMTGCTTTGNKIRKLEFLLGDALAKGYNSIITAGSVQSNHARAVAVIARELGLDVHVFLRTRDYDKPEKVGSRGNLLFYKMMGVDMHLVKPQEYVTGVLPKMNVLASQLAVVGQRPYLIGIGGSNEVGVWGYIHTFAEMIEQSVCENFTDVVVAIGSGGTASGLAIGNYLSGSKVNIHAVAVCDTVDYFYDHVDEMLQAIGLSEEISSRQILHIHEAQGKGYAINTEEELQLGMTIARKTGIILDPVYSLKATKGLIDELSRSSNVFAPNAKILFMHTGGIYGLFDGRVDPLFDDSLAKTWPS